MKDRFIPVNDRSSGWKIYDRQLERDCAQIWNHHEKGFETYARDMAHHICKFLNTEEG